MTIACGLSNRVFMVSALVVASGCGQFFYTQTPTGNFSGRLTVEWVEPNQFVYRPDPKEPLVYTTSRGQRIQPRTMYTDAGSIPRLFWSSPGLGPWDFAPGYVIHDWLFEQHHCKEGDWQQYDFKLSADILAEAMKTQMSKAGKPDPTLVWAVHRAVSSDIARNLWDTGECKKPSVAPEGAPKLPTRKPVQIKVIDFR
jgi:hypothetical protein